MTNNLNDSGLLVRADTSPGEYYWDQSRFDAHDIWSLFLTGKADRVVHLNRRIVARIAARASAQNNETNLALTGKAAKSAMEASDSWVCQQDEIEGVIERATDLIFYSST